MENSLIRFNVIGKLGIGLILLMISIRLNAQEESGQAATSDSMRMIINQIEYNTSPGQVKVIQDPRLTRLLRKHYNFNKARGGPGWKILIYKGRDRSQAYSAEARFVEVFRDLNLPVEVRYNEPDFSTIVGAFRTKEDAFRFRQMLVDRFPQAYLVPERIYSEKQ
jgi:hypothetical protein